MSTAIAQAKRQRYQKNNIGRQSRVCQPERDISIKKMKQIDDPSGYLLILLV